MSALIDCQLLSKNYGRTRALQDINLTLEPGAPIALVGPNGAGKTTLLSLLCGYIRPSSGSMRVLGQAAGSPAAIAQLSALPQDASLDPNFSIGVQITHYARLRGVRQPASEAKRVLSLVQLDDRFNAKATELSHGMRKRVLLAQSLIGEPSLVLLDEPTAGIDPPNVKIIRELIARQSTNATFIVSSHNLDELEKVCSTVVHLAAGTLRGVSAIDDVNNEGVLSILISADTPVTIENVQQLDGVNNAQLRTPTDLIIEYDHQHFPQTDISVLSWMAEHGIRYRRISKGRSLEEQVFN